jgi:hypothetical protein
MTETIQIDRVRRQTLRERIGAVVNIDPNLLFKRFYVLFGFTITCSLFAAAFLSFMIHREYLATLFAAAPASTAVWGIAYGAWNKRLNWAWATLTAIATLGMLAGIFVVLTQSGMSDLLLELIIGAGAAPVLWALTFGIRKLNW